MDIDFIRASAALATIIIGAIGLHRFVRMDYERKITELKDYLITELFKCTKQLDVDRNDIVTIHVRYAELNTTITNIRESIDKIDKKIDNLTKNNVVS